MLVFDGILSLKLSCQQLESQLQSSQEHPPSTDVAIQCSPKNLDQISQTHELQPTTDDKNLKIQSENDILQDEINNLNFQLSTFFIQRTSIETVREKQLIANVVD